ncbi:MULTISPECIES: DUF4129 domain-containing protein [Flavobacterium]|uniref:DUF4129 domain-containing protein n=1 Tax=Flavobacterium TaxID=237 RepID=UPI00188AFD2A|nr:MULTISPECIES: DUF4129 domain-containing protein [Flavobacterium]MBF4471178.1 DUF4129 domain-containing protein [Flavobacterium sp. HJJ]
MNKFFLLIFFFFYFNAGAKDSLAAAKKEKIIFTEKDIVIDTASVTAKSFPENFKKKYTDTDFIYEFKTPEKNAWDRFKEWLSNFLKKLFSISDNKTSSLLVDILIRVIAIAVVITVIYMIVKAIMNNEGQWVFGKNSDKKIINYDEIEKNLHLADFEKLIQSSLESGEKRLTARYYYLWLLKKMSDRQIIEWDIEKTNSDYLYEIKNQAQKEDFAYLSYLYNNIWYGEFELDDSTFEKTRSAFEKSIKKVSNG